MIFESYKCVQEVQRMLEIEKKGILNDALSDNLHISILWLLIELKINEIYERKLLSWYLKVVYTVHLWQTVICYGAWDVMMNILFILNISHILIYSLGHANHILFNQSLDHLNS